MPDKIGQRGQRLQANDKRIFHKQTNSVKHETGRKETAAAPAIFIGPCNAPSGGWLFGSSTLTLLLSHRCFSLMKKATLLLVTLTLFSAAGCQRTDDEVQPRSYDALALETGHWEWESTTVGFSSHQTPASVGFTRQLVFTADGKVLIQHDNRLNKTVEYQLSMGTLAGCGASQPAVPIITYTTESDIKSGDRKAYSITKSGTGQRLAITCDYACIDGGAYESYHWVAE